MLWNIMTYKKQKFNTSKSYKIIQVTHHDISSRMSQVLATLRGQEFVGKH